jgi:hypothetical protein
MPHTYRPFWGHQVCNAFRPMSLCPPNEEKHASTILLKACWRSVCVLEALLETSGRRTTSFLFPYRSLLNRLVHFPRGAVIDGGGQEPKTSNIYSWRCELSNGIGNILNIRYRTGSAYFVHRGQYCRIKIEAPGLKARRW